MDISKEMAVIISFQPEPEKIIRNVNCIAEQVGHVILIDIGLPINYNRAAKYAYKHCYEWLIIFDQDTLIQEILGIDYWIMSQSRTLL